jgi:hypothetical protein
MDPRRAQLARLFERRRRRNRLLLVCLVTAVACGTVAGLAGPQILVGGTARVHAGRAAAHGPAVEPEAAASPLDLAGRVALDPREAQANAIRWQAMPAADRRALLDRYWSLAGLDAGQVDRLVDQYGEFRELSEGRRAYLRQRAQKLKEFMAGLGPQDQAVLEGMSDEDRARRLLELWQARYGQW